MSMSSQWVQGQRHPALEQVVAEFARDDFDVDWETDSVMFVGKDGVFTADIDQGESRVRVFVALFLPARSDVLSDDSVHEWWARQPQPATGLLQLEEENDEEHGAALVPTLVFERSADDLDLSGIASDVNAFADAWDSGDVATPPTAIVVNYGDPTAQPPRAAWILIGSESSYPSSDELHEERDRGAVGIFDLEWTAPKNSDVGDLALMYFIAPRKAARFVARIASRPFLQTGVESAPDDKYDMNQWWCALTPLVEIEPIPYAEIKAAADGHLLLHGKGGKYLSPRAIARLTFNAVRPDEQELVDRITQVPEGPVELPKLADIDLDTWSSIPAGMLAVEAQVEDYVVDPLLAFVNEHRGDARIALPPLLPKRQHRLARQIVDYAILCDGIPLAAVEVKLSLRRPVGGDWMTSPDFRQVRAYMDEMDVPGLLVDSRSIWLVPRGAEAPSCAFERASATDADIIAIVDLIFDQAYEVLGGTLGIRQRGA
jgi:hypothetical protein